MNWVFINTEYLPGEANMMFDKALIEQVQKENDLAFLRFYGWRPSAISIGYNQDESDFDKEKIKAAGIDLVRRPTGGKAILHSHELTYSVAMSLNQQSLRGVYQFINEGLLAGVRLLGINATMSASSDSVQQLYRNPESVACFSSSAKCEIQFRNRKLIGSAQRRFGDVVLQHGSFLLDSRHHEITEFLSSRNAGKNTVEVSLREHATDAETILGHSLTFEEAANAIKMGFEKAWNVTFIDAMQDLLNRAPILN